MYRGTQRTRRRRNRRTRRRGNRRFRRLKQIRGRLPPAGLPEWETQIAQIVADFGVLAHADCLCDGFVWRPIGARSGGRRRWMGCYDVEEMKKYRDPIIPGHAEGPCFNVPKPTWGSRPLTVNRIAQTSMTFTSRRSMTRKGAVSPLSVPNRAGKDKRPFIKGKRINWLEENKNGSPECKLGGEASM